ncbi:MAG: glycosyltransferase family 39 protein [Nanoarchaeota archaeon]
MDNKQVALILVLVLGIGLFLRVWSLGSESIWLDEAVSIRQSQETWSKGLEYLERDIHPPLYMALLHIWIRLFGISEAAVRSLSVLFGTATVLLGFLVARKLFGQQVALLSALLLAVSPVLVYYSQEARMYALFTLTTLLSTFLFLRFLDRMAVGRSILYILGTALALYTHYFSVLLLMVHSFFFLVVRHRGRSTITRWLFIQGVILLLFVPWLPALIRQLRQSLSLVWIQRPHLSTIYETFSTFLGTVWLTVLFFLLLVLFIKRAKSREVSKQQAVGFFFLSIGVLLPVLGVFIFSLFFTPVYNFRYLLFTLPAVLTFFSFLIMKVIQKRMVRGAVIATVSLISLFLVLQQGASLEKDDWRSVSRYLRQQTQPGGRIFIDPFYHQHPLAYYYRECFQEEDLFGCNFRKHGIISIDGFHPCCDGTTPVTPMGEGNLFGDWTGGTVWLVSVRPELYSSGKTLQDYFLERKRVEKVEYFAGGIILYKFTDRAGTV